MLNLLDKYRHFAGDIAGTTTMGKFRYPALCVLAALAGAIGFASSASALLVSVGGLDVADTSQVGGLPLVAAGSPGGFFKSAGSLVPWWSPQDATNFTVTSEGVKANLHSPEVDADDVFAYLDDSNTLPEPMTWAMMLAGFAVLGFVASHRTRKKDIAII